MVSAGMRAVPSWLAQEMGWQGILPEGTAPKGTSVLA